MSCATIFCDIDGVLLYQNYDFLTTFDSSCLTDTKLPSIILNWHNKGYRIILTSGRPESMRELTVSRLAELKIIYDQLILGLGPGPRYLINDIDPKEPEVIKAIAINIARNIPDLEMLESL